ncbi:hypothetical protein ACJMK2_034420 [Sinanodonta woodiana]|uniref:Cyclin-F n=1 Tax=Sinanodonta woodiana TaxID=1069815 RepID=A0ABD3WRH7_SINWO
MKILKALSGFQHQRNTFIPVHKHLRPRPQSERTVTIWNLPEEILVYIMKGLHMQDLLSMKLVHSYFNSLLNNNTSVWTNASFQNSWPSQANLVHFEKAANVGNIEALVKLALAYLYNEGLSGDQEGRKVNSNGEKAAEIFCRVENLTNGTDPFTWLFIRPPWSVNGACCKESVFRYMKEYLHTEDNKNIKVCVAKTLQLLNEEETREETAAYLQKAASQNSGIAAYMLWKQNVSLTVMDKASELESIRKLRVIANLDCLEAKLELCHYYSLGKYGGISKEKAASFIQDFIHSIQPFNIQDSFRTSQELTASMRYILVDWLAEVCGMKDFSSQTLHVAVSLMDRFLRVHTTSRSKLQLLGVAAMVLCSRFLGRDIITIREAAWLTDNTYKYEDVVRMMGEITATLRGNIRVANIADFVEIFNTIVGHDKRTYYLTHYICELSLLQAEMGQYSPAEIAASSILLARLLLKMESPWPSEIQEITGFTIEDLSRCSFHIHEKCFLEGSVVDHRDITLQAVKQRFANEQFYKVSEIEIISYKQLCGLLGVTEHILHGRDVRVKFRNLDELIVSPSRSRQRKNSRLRDVSCDCDATDTPTIENSFKLNESVLSGYDGDREDTDESFCEMEDSEDPKKDVLSDEGMGSESDTYFASSLCSQTSPKMMTLNMSFSSASPPLGQCLYFSSHNFICDNNSSSSGVSSPTFRGSNSSSPSPSTSGASVFPPFNNVKVMSMRLMSTGSSLSSSDSESSCGVSCSKKQRSGLESAKHMTLRESTRRKRRRSSGAKAYIFQ